MQKETNAVSDYTKYLLLFLLITFLLYFGKTLFIPLFFAFLVAIVMYPIGIKLEGWGISKPLSIVICLLIVSLLIAGLLALIIWQIKLFQQDAPTLMASLNNTVPELEMWLKNSFDIEIDIREKWQSLLVNTIGDNLRSTFNSLVNLFFIGFLVPVFTALIMYHRSVFVSFIKLQVHEKYQERTNLILKQTVHTYSNYIKGMIFVYLIVGTLNSIGLFFIGVNHPLMYGMLCAIMTIIPYLGTMLSSLLPITVIWLQTGNFWFPLAVVALFVFVQYLEGNVIFPKVVGFQLNVSTFATLVAVIAGGIVWGIAGMVLFIPFVAILKIMSEHIPEWEGLNLLLKR